MVKKLVLSILFSIALVACQKKQQADSIIHNAKVYSFDSEFSITQAIVIKDGIIIALGDNESILSKYSGKKINVNGRFIFPKFNLKLDSIRKIIINSIDNYNQETSLRTPISNQLKIYFKDYSPLEINQPASLNIVNLTKSPFHPIETWLHGEVIYNIHLSRNYPISF
jgi:hypothetical protein